MHKVNINQIVHSASPFFMGVALHSWTVTGEPIASGWYPLGFVLGKPKQGLITFDARVTEPFADNESLTLNVKVVHQDSTTSTVLTAVLDENSGTGTINLLPSSGALPVRAGDILYLFAVYFRSGGANAPLVSLLFQVG